MDISKGYLLSIILYPTSNIYHHRWLHLCHNTYYKKITGIKATIKWLLIYYQQQKVGGIIEGTIQHINVGYAVIGVD